MSFWLRLSCVFVSLLLVCSVTDAVGAEKRPDPSENKELESTSGQDGGPSQSPSSSPGAFAKLLESFSAYGSLRTRLLFTEEAEELQNGSSRLGIGLRRSLVPLVVPDLTAVGRVEVQVNLVENPTVTTAGDSTNSELLTEENVDAFETRLGYVGFEFGELASVSFGKQWAVYYDVAGWTDLFYVFGGTSLGVYNRGTDGGGGTGRADQAIVARLELDWLAFGAQYQVRGFDVISGRTFGASLRARPIRLRPRPLRSQGCRRRHRHRHSLRLRALDGPLETLASPVGEGSV